MIKRFELVKAGVLLMLTVVMTTGAAAQHRTPLPDFRLQQGTQSIAGTQAFGRGRTLVLFVTPGCRPCTTLLRSLGTWATPALVANTVVVVSGDAAAASTYVADTLPAALNAVRWYADPDGAAAKALALRGAPVLIGLEEGEIDWTVAGVLGQTDMLESIVRRWVEGPAR